MTAPLTPERLAEFDLLIECGIPLAALHAKELRAEVDRLRDRLRAQVTAVESLAEKIEATADQDEEAAASIGTSAGQTRLQALADNGRWTVRELRAALASGGDS